MENEILPKISSTEFKDRLALLCLVRGGRGFPRKPRDQHILFKSITLMLEPQRTYTESEVNENLTQWLRLVGQAIELDHVSLRRYLVDAGYLTRNAAGQSYRVNLDQTIGLFEVGVEEINPMTVVEQAARQTEERKRTYLEKTERD
jgi:hypothetical protein